MATGSERGPALGTRPLCPVCARPPGRQRTKLFLVKGCLGTLASVFVTAPVYTCIGGGQGATFATATGGSWTSHPAPINHLIPLGNPGSQRRMNPLYRCGN